MGRRAEPDAKWLVMQDFTLASGLNCGYEDHLVVFFNNDYNEPSQHGSSGGIDENSFNLPETGGVVLCNYYVPGGPHQSFFMLGAHEIGHSLGLWHPYDLTTSGSFCDNLDDTHCPDASNGYLPWCDPYAGGTTYDGCTNNLMSGSRDKEWLSPLQQGMAHYYLEMSGYFTEKCDYDSLANEIEIDSLEIWDKARMVNTNIIVHSGGELQIKCRLSMAGGTRIVVETGGRLIVDGGTITNICRDYWQGIQVNGSPRLAQLPTSNQGYVKVFNGGRIEYALIGIETQTRDGAGGFTRSKSGGIIHAQEATFFNCVTGVKIWPYEFGTSLNQCSFVKSDFITDHQQFMQYYSPMSYPEIMLDVSGVNMLEVKACKFENVSYSYPNPSGVTYENRGIGINAVDASLLITGICGDNNIPCEDYLKTEFYKLEYGIHATYIDPLRSITIDSCEFKENYRGIYLSGSEQTTITRNYFKSPWESRIGPNLDPNAIQIYTDQCTDYTIEQNRLEYFGTLSIPYYGIGIVIDNSGDQMNYLYNNEFEDLEYAVIAQDYNKEFEGDMGLQLLCNEFVTCEFDISVTNEMMVEGMGIRPWQGDPTTILTTYCANNIFTNLSSVQFSDYYNECDEFIYSYSDNDGGFNLEPLYISSTVNKVLRYTSPTFDRNIHCPDNYTNGGGSSESEAMLLTVISDLSNELDAIEQEYEAIIDGGNSSTLLQQVYSAGNSTNVKAGILLANSPNLSDSILYLIASDNVNLPKPLAAKILYMNPRAAKSHRIKQAINDRADKFSSSQVDSIISQKNSYVYHESLRERILQNKGFRRAAINKLTNLYLQHGILIDSISDILANHNISLDETKKKLRYFDTTPNVNTQPIDDYLKIYSRLNDSLWVNAIDTTDINLLIAISSGSDIFACYSRNILEVYGVRPWSEPYYLPKYIKNETSDYEANNVLQQSSQIRCYPNPTTGIVSFEFNHSLGGTLMIFNSVGELIRVTTVEENSSIITLDMGNIPVGIYHIIFDSTKSGRNIGSFIKN